MPAVTEEEIDDAFYRSYGEGTPAGLNAGLADAAAPKGRRKLTLAATDAQHRECWMETARLLREERACVPAPGAPVGAVVLACPAAATNTDRPKFEPMLWNDYDEAVAVTAEAAEKADIAAFRLADVAAKASPGNPLAQTDAATARAKALASIAVVDGLGPIQRSTNCYSYAVNSRTGHPIGKKPQPGEKAKTPAASANCPDVTAAVVADGLPDNITEAKRCPYNKQQHKPPPEKAGCYLVALVSTSRPDGYDAVTDKEYVNDYHWYRQDEDGGWSHKPGHAQATNMDSDGMAISNPETAKRRTVYPKHTNQPKDLVIDYDVFCGYFYVKKGGAPVGP